MEGKTSERERGKKKKTLILLKKEKTKKCSLIERVFSGFVFNLDFNNLFFLIFDHIKFNCFPDWQNTTQNKNPTIK